MSTETEARTANILAIYFSATDAERSEGESWYHAAHTFCVGASERYGISVRRAAGIVAALSPRVSWDLNLRMAETLLREGTVPGLKGNVRKAQRILTGEDPDAVLGGPKVRAFFACIADPHDADAVVIDRHAYDAAYGAVGDDKVRKSLDRKGEYDRIAQLYRDAAAYAGVRPHVMQAATWVAWRRLKKEGKV